MDESIRSAVQRWLNDPAIVPADKRPIRELLDRGDERELTDRFHAELEFGTGGIRGILGAGPNRMNVYTVGAAAQGLADTIRREGAEAMRRGAAIAYDSRRMSAEFARRVAGVCAANGIHAYLFDAPRPTPELSFAIRRLGCTAGVVITASHNPPEYNGFKCYWSDGGQVVPPQDNAIINAVRAVGGYGNVKYVEPFDAAAAGRVTMIGDKMDAAFLEGVQASCLAPDLCRQQGGRLRIVYTPLHGTGWRLAPQALARRGFQHVTVVPEQEAPDGDFPTVSSPNPEEGAALKLAIDLARREKADLVIGTDPDADRVGIAVRDREGEFRLVTGNQTGAILCHYICEQLTRQGRFPANAVVLSTIVSSDLMKEIARSYGAEVIETLTGFKWIADQIRRFEEAGVPQSPIKTYLFGAEESYGYMPGAFVRDKDAITAAAFIAEAAAFAASDGKTLLDVLDDLYRRFGYFEEGVKSLTLPGADGAAKIAAMMEAHRADPPRVLGGIDVARWADIRTGEIRQRSDGSVVGRYDLPASNVIMLMLADGTKVIARPSGTEPKIKFYILARADGGDLDAARRSTRTKIDAILGDLIQSTGNGV